MNKKLIIILSTIAAIVIIAIGATTAYFSNTETSSGNTFIAGAIDLKIDNECHLNGRVCADGYWQGTSDPCDCTWKLMDLDGKAIFYFDDVKPGDDGEDTISLHVDSNPAWVCVEVSNVAQAENGCNIPEAKVDETCGDAGVGEGELWSNLTFSIWMDDDCDNVYDPEDAPYLVENAKATDLKWPIADSQHGQGPIRDACIGVAWSVPDGVGNIIQGDSVTGDITFNAYQARNNENFVCNPPQIVCGNGEQEEGEECDYGAANGQLCDPPYSGSCDYCSVECKIVNLTDGYCGDGNVDVPYEVCEIGQTQSCEIGGYAGQQSCSGCQWSECVPTGYCGDGIVNDAEECDGSAPEHYTCEACKLVYQPYCGDGTVNQPSEECDDGNTNSADGCSYQCKLEAQLTIVKEMVNNDGGNNVAGDFQLYVGGSAVNSGQAYWHTPGAYVVSETGVPGYDAKFSIECPDGNITLASGDNKICTLTNDDIKPIITLHKSVINDNGGTAGPFDFSMRIDGVLVPSGTSKLVTANAAHTITEDAKAGYHLESITGASECPDVLGGTATLDEGVSITCTITNDDD